MHLEPYIYFNSNNFQDYEFYSDGPNGKIKKAVRFAKINDEPVIYNLGFGDVNEDTDEIDDKAISNNGDGDKVLATVASTIIDFTRYYRHYYVFAVGSTPSRTRLYQMGISTLLDEINIDFEILGFMTGLWQPFRKNVNYEGFLIRRK